MTRAGVPVNEVVACPGLGSGAAAELLVGTIAGAGYQAVRVGPDRIQFARTFRPRWATVLGFVGLPVFFLGIVCFFVKRTESCVAQIEEDHRGARIRLGGLLDRQLLAHLAAAFADPDAAAAAAASAAGVGAPVASAYELVTRTAAVPDRSAIGPPPGPPCPPPPPIPSPAPTVSPRSVGVVGSGPDPTPAAVPPRWWDDDEDAPDATRVVRSGRPTPSQGHVGLDRVLHFDDGRRLAADGLLLVGRDPAGVVGDHDGTVAVADLSVSKRHMEISARADGVWVKDRHSTNGTRVRTPDGGERPLVPGEWTHVPDGSSIVFGARTVVVSAGPVGGCP